MTSTTHMDVLGRDTWRYYIDLDRQDRGSAAFDEGIGGTREPGYLASVLAAHDYARARIGQAIGLEDYVELQNLVTQHEPPDELWRPGKAWVQAPRVALEPRIETIWEPLGVSIDEEADTSPGWVRILMTHHAGAVDALEADVVRMLAEGQAEIEAATGPEALMAIARLHQALELLHPTRDTNTRRHLVLLQWLLANAGYLPSLLTEPNHVYARHPASWARCIDEGTDRTRAVHHAHQRGLDVAEVLTAFDVRRHPIGSGIGRWHRPEAPDAGWLDLDPMKSTDFADDAERDSAFPGGETPRSTP